MTGFRGPQGPPPRGFQGRPPQQHRPTHRPGDPGWGVQMLNGKPYFSVARRVYDFRQTHLPDDGWAIRTDFRDSDELWICRAEIVDPQGRVVATGTAASPKTGGKSAEKTNPLECAETSAIGRALAAFGYVSNGSYASAEEVRQALARRGEKEAQR